MLVHGTILDQALDQAMLLREFTLFSRWVKCSQCKLYLLWTQKDPCFVHTDVNNHLLLSLQSHGTVETRNNQHSDMISGSVSYFFSNGAHVHFVNQ